MNLRTIMLCGLVFVGVAGCASTTSTANERVRQGMSMAQVTGLLGNADSREFYEKYEAWQYSDVVAFGECEYVTIFFAGGTVRSMTSRRRFSAMGCTLGSRSVDWSQTVSSASSGGNAPAHDPEEPPRPAGASGSCFFVSNDGMAITNHHVIEGGEKFLVLDHQKRELVAQLVKIDPANDLALLRADGVLTEPLSFAPIGSLATGDEVFGFGYPVAGLLGEEAKFTDGVVSSTTGLLGASNIFQMSVPIQPGSSGGPIVNFQGQVVGIATSSAHVGDFLRDYGTLPQSINWAVKGEYAQLLAGIESTEAIVVSRNQAIEIARRASCRIIVN